MRLGTHSNAPPQVFLDVGISSPELDDWTPIEGEGSFQVVPAPGGIGALVAAALFTGRRRRACAMDNATDPSLYVAAKVGVAGTGLHDWLTVKVLDDGTVAWQSALSVAGAGDDQPTAVAVGTRKDLGTLKNFVFVTGYTRTAAQGNRFTTACYEDTGNCPACGVELWVNRTDGTFAAGDDRGVAIITQPTHVTDAPVSAFVTGRLRQAGGDYDIHTMKFQSNPEPPQVPGVPRWEIAFSGPNDDVPVSIWYEPSVWDEEIGQFKPGVFIGGNTVGATTGLDWLTIRYSEITP
ncbi:MAG: hypothetical protein IT437_05055 [Phycisphaerales bacterium]|nr:hypothetical protein [Phycisphaerales bacterium]